MSAVTIRPGQVALADWRRIPTLDDDRHLGPEIAAAIDLVATEALLPRSEALRLPGVCEP